ncbi:MAG: 50S ribosome-binding GTPase [Saprospiraceae bacterium]|nr:50S ribosome-binding GTPase [Saprospiraceae bacterium]
MNLLRFITAGSVDDGKSTLIGRLLYDSNAIFEDQLQAMRRASRFSDTDTPDLAILTDGLKAEREQGITIDVAYKYFSTSRRKFIIADAPGHVQYTRNMVTGASNCDLAIILVDARNGVVEQTRRHTYLTSLLGIRHLVVAVNKMDMIGYDEEAFYRIAAAFKQFSNQLNFKTIHFIPVSALHGENIVQGSVHFSWYQGPALLQYLEEINTEDDHFADAARLPVQWVIRPQSDDLHDYRGYAGRLTSGTLRVGDAVGVYPGGQTSRIERIEMYGKDLAEAESLDSIVLHLQDDIDVSRGDIIAPLSAAPVIGQELKARICWMDDEKHLIPGGKYLLQHHGKKVRCVVRDLVDKIQIDTLQFVDAQDVKLNDIATVGIKTASPLAVDLYADNRSNGAFILIDEMTCRTVAAGMVLECS